MPLSIQSLSGTAASHSINNLKDATIIQTADSVRKLSAGEGKQVVLHYFEADRKIDGYFVTQSGQIRQVFQIKPEYMPKELRKLASKQAI